MINLEAIQLRRAEEQMARPAPRILGLGVVMFHNDRSLTARKLLCACGVCHRCRNRQAMRVRRAMADKPPPKPRGPSMALGRVCAHVYANGDKCTTRIADWNRTGLCRGHRKQAWDHVNRDRRTQP